MTSDLLKQSEIESFIRHELLLLNRNEFSQWIDLYTDDGVYFMPLDESQTDPERYDMIMFDNKPLMKIRKENFGREDSPSMEYPIRSMRMISECIIERQDEHSCYVEAPFMASIFYQKMRWFAGNYYYDLVVAENEIRIKSKQVNLLDMGAPQGPILTYL